jgi:hypothetical protein
LLTQNETVQTADVIPGCRVTIGHFAPVDAVGSAAVRHAGVVSDDHRTRLLRAIGASAVALDDDELSRRTRIRPRQTVNQVLRRLEREGVVRRYKGSSSKIVTEVVAANDENDHRAADPVEVVTPRDRDNPQPVLDRIPGHTRPAGSSAEQRDAERIMLDLLGNRIGRPLEPATIKLLSGSRVEIDGADNSRTVLVECWAHQGSPKGGQKHKVLTDALKLTWIASTIYPRPELILCMSDPLAAAPFLPGSRSWAAQALHDLGIRIELVQLPEDIRLAVLEAQMRQYR